MYKQIESWLIANGFLHPSHTGREKFSGVWFACSIVASSLLLLIAIVDIALLDRLLFPVLRPLGIAALGAIGVGVILIILSTNRII